METRASYLMVGFFVLALAFGLLGFVLWLAKYQSEAGVDGYDILFQGSITGLKEGSPVRFSGVRIGQVTTIALDPQKPGDVRVTIEVERENSPVRADTEASLELEGLTGGRYILLHAGALDAPPASPPEAGGNPRLATRPSAFDQVLEGAPEVLENANLLLLRANALLNEENTRNLSELLRQLAQITSDISSHREEILSLITDASSTMTNLREASTSLQGLATALEHDAKILSAQAQETLGALKVFAEKGSGAVDGLSGQATGTLKAFENLALHADDRLSNITLDATGFLESIETTSRQLEATMGEIEAMVAENREPLRDFTAGGLYQFSILLTEARALVRELGFITTEIQSDPARFFFGDRNQGYEAQQ